MKNLYNHPARKRRNRRPEQSLQTGVFNQLKPLMAFQGHQQFIAFQIRNESGIGGKQGAILGKYANQMGRMAGVSDTLFVFPAQKIMGAFEIAERMKCPEGIKSLFPKTVFVEFKPYKPLKTKKRDPESLMSVEQKEFRKRVESLGFEYRLIAATDHLDALRQVYALLRENGVTGV